MDSLPVLAGQALHDGEHHAQHAKAAKQALVAHNLEGGDGQVGLPQRAKRAQQGWAWACAPLLLQPPRAPSLEGVEWVRL